MEIHEQRPPQERRADEAKQAQDITTDVEKWASDPDSFDFPGVDTVLVGADVEIGNKDEGSMPAFDETALDLAHDADFPSLGDVTDPGTEPLFLDEDDSLGFDPLL